MVSFMAVACLGVSAPARGTEDRTPSGARKVGGGFYPKPAPETSGKWRNARAARAGVAPWVAGRRIPAPYRAGMVRNCPGRTTFGSGRVAGFASRMSGHSDASP